MRKSTSLCILTTLFFTTLVTADDQQYESQAMMAQPAEANIKQNSSFRAFTGKISRNKVRMRLQATLDSPVIRELNKGDMLVVVGQTDEFYAVEPPSDIQGFIYRTLILDNVVEGNNVNVRLEPNLDAPVIAQLHNGDTVDGKISPLNNKWLEIPPPKSTRFYVSRDFIENIGDASLLATINQRRQEVNTLLVNTKAIEQDQFQKPFVDMNFDQIVAGYKKIIDSYSDFPDQAAQARSMLAAAQEEFLKRKVAYLEEQNEKKNLTIQEKNARLKETAATQQRLSELQAMANNNPNYSNSNYQAPQQAQAPKTPPAKLTGWIPAEDAYYQGWCSQNGQCSKEHFYSAQRAEAITLKGRVEPYTRAVKNKPGDYVLVNSNHLPIAYLYSTFINLQDYIGHEVTILVASRPNNHFAFPAYFVLEVD